MSKMISIDIGVGEALDRLSILDIKKQKLSPDKAKIAGQQFEELYFKLVDKNITAVTNDQFYQELLKINGELWELEDKIRELSHSLYNMPDQTFDVIMHNIGQHVRVGCDIHDLNDRRYQTKCKADLHYTGEITEVKSV